MYYFTRQNKNWLKFVTILKIHQKHKELVQSKFWTGFGRVMNYIFDRNRWWLISIIVILLFFLSLFIKIEFLSFINIDFDTAKNLVDQRTTNIATIISITLVVVGFLINSLAVKESFSYKLLFKHSKLFPIIYFTLSTIGCLVIVSTLRNTLDEEKFIRAVILGTYLVLLVLLFIGYLFRTIIYFTNSKQIESWLKDELISDSKLRIKLFLIKKYSYDFYESLMNKYKIKKHNILEDLVDAGRIGSFTEVPEEEALQHIQSRKMVCDINISRVNKFIGKKIPEGSFSYDEMSIGKWLDNVDNYLWIDGKQNSKKEKQFLKGSIVVSKNVSNQQYDSEVRKYFEEKLDEWITENKQRGVEFILNSYLDVIELQLKNRPK